MAEIAKTKYTSQYIDNLSFDDQLKVKIVEIIGADGFLKNPATSDNQDPLASYKQAGMDISGDPMYFGFLKTDGSWYIKCLDISTGTTYAKGDSGYTTAWTGRDGLTYDDFNNVF